MSDRSGPNVAVILRAGTSPPAAIAAAGLIEVPLDAPSVDAVIVIGGLNVARTIPGSAPPVLLLVPAGDRRALSRADASDIAGVLTDDVPAHRLRAAVDAIITGLAVRSSETARGNELTSRQQQLLGLVVLGLSNAEIAERLYLTQSTVKSHLNAAYRKLGVRSRKEAVARILDPDSGIGLGILELGAQSTRVNYARPEIRSDQTGSSA